MDISQAFGSIAREYDFERRKLISCFDDFYGVATGLVPWKKNDSFSVLDLGAGTGLFSSFVNHEFPLAKITLQDISEEMLQRAKERFAGNDRVGFIVSDYIHNEIPGQFDVVISALSLHHSTAAELSSVFTKIYSSLNPGGIFINSDQIQGQTPEIENTYMQKWLEEAYASGSTEAEVNAAQERRKFDKTLPLEIQLQFLQKAGFEKINCWYQYYMFAVYSGVKPL